MTSDSTPPRLAARRKRRTRSQKRRGQPTLYIEREHRTEPAHLVFCQQVIRMRLQTGIMYAFHFRMALQVFGDGHGIFALALDPNAERVLMPRMRRYAAP